MAEEGPSSVQDSVIAVKKNPDDICGTRTSSPVIPPFPPNLIEMNPDAYIPHVVSVGPLYLRKLHRHYSMEDFKIGVYYGGPLSQTDLEFFAGKIGKRHSEVLEFYGIQCAADDGYDADALSLMMTGDAFHCRLLRQGMATLIETVEDVALLRRSGVIYPRDDHTSDQDIAGMWKGLLKPFFAGYLNTLDHFLIALLEPEYYSISVMLIEYWQEFKRTYYSKPWLAVSLAGGILVTLMTAAQVLCLFYPCSSVSHIAKF